MTIVELLSTMTMKIWQASQKEIENKGEEPVSILDEAQSGFKRGGSNCCQEAPMKVPVLISGELCTQLNELLKARESIETRRVQSQRYSCVAKGFFLTGAGAVAAGAIVENHEGYYLVLLVAGAAAIVASCILRVLGHEIAKKTALAPYYKLILGEGEIKGLAPAICQALSSMQHHNAIPSRSSSVETTAGPKDNADVPYDDLFANDY